MKGIKRYQNKPEITGDISGIGRENGGNGFYSGSYIAEVYFSLKNIAAVDRMVRKKILNELKVDIPPQDANEMLVVMNDSYQNYLEKQSYKSSHYSVSNFMWQTVGEFVPDPSKFAERGKITLESRNNIPPANINIKVQKNGSLGSKMSPQQTLVYLNNLAIDYLFENAKRYITQRKHYEKYYNQPFNEFHQRITNAKFPAKIKDPDKNGPNKVKTITANAFFEKHYY